MDGFFAGLFDLVDEEKNKKLPKQKQELSDVSVYDEWSSGVESDDATYTQAFFSPMKKTVPVLKKETANVEEEKEK